MIINGPVFSSYFCRVCFAPHTCDSRLNASLKGISPDFQKTKNVLLKGFMKKRQGFYRGLIKKLKVDLKRAVLARFWLICDWFGNLSDFVPDLPH